MLKQGSKLYSIIFLKCPRCHKGKFFNNGNPYRIKGYFDMPENCASCGQKFNIEPGFYYGAMYVSYGICVGLAILFFLISKFIFNLSNNEFLVALSIFFTLLLPYLFKVSRALWINFFVHYRNDQ